MQRVTDQGSPWKSPGLQTPGLWLNNAGILKLRSGEQRREMAHLGFLPSAPPLTLRWSGSSRDAERGSHNLWEPARWEQSVAEELGSLGVEAKQHPGCQSWRRRKSVLLGLLCL